MTIPNANYSNRYEGNGVATSFAYTFRILEDSDIAVVTTDEYGNETTLTLDVDYSVAGAGDATGSITYPISGTALPAASFITIYRVAGGLQPTDLVNQGPWLPENIEASLDRLQAQINAVRGGLARTPKLTPGNETQTAGSIVDLTPNKYLITDTYGNVATGESTVGENPVLPFAVSGDGIVYTGAVELCGVDLASNGAADATIILYDNTAASGTTLTVPLTCPAADRQISRPFAIPVKCLTGIYANIGGAGASAIVYYREV